MPFESLPCIIAAPAVEFGEELVTDGSYTYISAADMLKKVNFRGIIETEVPRLSGTSLKDAVQFVRARFLHHGASPNEVYLISDQDLIRRLDWVVAGVIGIGTHEAPSKLTARQADPDMTAGSATLLHVDVIPYSFGNAVSACKVILEQASELPHLQVAGQTWPPVSPRKDGKGSLKQRFRSTEEGVQLCLSDLRAFLNGESYH